MPAKSGNKHSEETGEKVIRPSRWRTEKYRREELIGGGEQRKETGLHALD